MPGKAGGPESAAGVTRGGLNPDILKRRFLCELAIGHAIEGHTAGEAKFIQAGAGVQMPGDGENYLLGGHYIEMIEACRIAARHVGKKGPKFTIPMGFVQAIAPIVSKLSKKGGSEDNPFSKAALDAIATSPIVDRSKAERDLGYQPRSLEQTMSDLVAHFVEKGHFKTGRAA